MASVFQAREPEREAETKTGSSTWGLKEPDSESTMNVVRIRRGSRVRIAGWLAVGLACAAASPGLAQPKSPAPPKAPPSPVEAAKVERRRVAAGQTFVGTVHPLKRSSVGSAVDGRVVEFPINQGDRVRKGEVLCQLLTETIDLQIASAQAELELKAWELKELENGTRKEEIEQAKARMESAKAVRDYSDARYKRALILAEQGRTVTKEQLEQSQSAAVEAEKTYRMEEMAYQMAVDGPRVEKVHQARAKHAAQKELVRQLEDQRKKHTMVAPFDGYVVSEQTEVGEWVSRGQVVAAIVYLDTVEIEAHVLDSHIDHVRPGMTVRVEVPAARPSLHVGEVSAVVPEADTKSRTFPVKVRVENILREDGPVLKSGMLARVTLPTGTPTDSLLVPKDAVVLGGPTPMVYAVVPSDGARDEGQVRPVPVQLGVADGQSIAVEGDLQPNQMVVVLGNERLRPGQDVKILKVRSAPAAEDAEPDSAKRN
jgi:RND family efflux transporter MFP subunit